MHDCLGRTLLKKMEEAVDQRLEHAIMHHDFESALDSSAVSTWTALVEAWEADRSKPNPYERKGEGKQPRGSLNCITPIICCSNDWSKGPSRTSSR
jgi:hypothetical protein